MKPKTWKARYHWVIFVLFSFVFSLGCASKEEKIAKHLEKAKQYMEENELREAVMELMNVVQLDPENDTAYYELGETYLKSKQRLKAFQSYSHAVSINPNNLEAHLKMGQIFLLRKEGEEARIKADLVLKKSRHNVDALILLSGVQLQEKNINSSLKTLQKAYRADPNHFETHLALARLFLIKWDFDRSEEAYLKAISLNSSSREPYIELARLYGKTGQWDKTESELKKMIQNSGSNYQNLNLLADFYESTQQWDQAEKTFSVAVDSAANGNVVPLMDLGRYFVRRNSYEKALRTMLKAKAIKRHDLNILASIAQLHFDFKNMEAAEATVNDILKKDKRQVRANFLKGRLYLLKNDFANALKRFDLVLEAWPRYHMAYYFRALSLIGTGERKLAQKDLLEAVELNPSLVDARLSLAGFYLRERNRSLAWPQIDSVLKQDPGNVKALMHQGILKVQERDVEGAEAVFKKVVNLNPDYAPGHLQLGALYELTDRQADALKALKKGLALDPQQTDALSSIVNMYIRDERFHEALQICEKQKPKIWENPSTLAAVEYLEGKVYMADWNPGKAQKQFEKAIKADPNMLAPYEALARLYWREEMYEEAIPQYENILSEDPKYLAGYMLLGTMYDVERDKEKAETYYRKALRISGDFGPAANNLAWNLAETGGDMDEALNFAKIAKDNMPKSATVKYTLGWIYFLQGSYQDAIEALQDSLELDPKNAEIHYHLGLAYYKNNQLDAAKDVLEQALLMDQDFKGAEEASSIVEEIKTLAALH
jgi:tetratricopeptide (TPR) repeat protein